MFIQNNAEITDTLCETSYVEGLGFLFYVGILLYLWLEYIKEQQPILYETLLNVYSRYLICRFSQYISSTSW